MFQHEINLARYQLALVGKVIPYLPTLCSASLSLFGSCGRNDLELPLAWTWHYSHCIWGDLQALLPSCSESSPAQFTPVIGCDVSTFYLQNSCIDLSTTPPKKKDKAMAEKHSKFLHLLDKPTLHATAQKLQIRTPLIQCYVLEEGRLTDSMLCSLHRLEESPSALPSPQSGTLQPTSRTWDSLQSRRFRLRMLGVMFW